MSDRLPTTFRRRPIRASFLHGLPRNRVSKKPGHITAVYEHRSIAIGSHSPFNDWGRFLPDQPTAVSLLDRLCHHAHIITTTGDSYRLTHRTTNRKEA